jgi:hypothetical protein
MRNFFTDLFAGFIYVFVILSGISTCWFGMNLAFAFAPATYRSWIGFFVSAFVLSFCIGRLHRLGKLEIL